MQPDSAQNMVQCNENQLFSTEITTPSLPAVSRGLASLESSPAAPTRPSSLSPPPPPPSPGWTLSAALAHCGAGCQERHWLARIEARWLPSPSPLGEPSRRTLRERCSRDLACIHPEAYCTPLREAAGECSPCCCC